jgi:hypothetical protein
MGTVKLLWASTRISMSGPTASRMAATQAMPWWAACDISAGVPLRGKPSHGAALSDLKPSATARFAVEAKPSGVRGFVVRLMLA